MEQSTTHPVAKPWGTAPTRTVGASSWNPPPLDSRPALVRWPFRILAGVLALLFAGIAALPGDGVPVMAIAGAMGWAVIALAPRLRYGMPPPRRRNARLWAPTVYGRRLLVRRGPETTRTDHGETLITRVPSVELESGPQPWVRAPKWQRIGAGGLLAAAAGFALLAPSVSLDDRLIALAAGISGMAIAYGRHPVPPARQLRPDNND